MPHQEDFPPRDRGGGAESHYKKGNWSLYRIHDSKYHRSKTGDVQLACIYTKGNRIQPLPNFSKANPFGKQSHTSPGTDKDPKGMNKELGRAV